MSFLSWPLTLLLSIQVSPLPSQERDAPGEAPDLQMDLEPLQSPAQGFSWLPNLTRGADGRVYLNWAQKHEDGDTTLQLARLEEDGWGPAREIVPASLAPEGPQLFLNWADFPGLAVLKDGTLLAFWLQRDGTAQGYNALFSISADVGRTWSDEQFLHDDLTSGEHGFVSVVALDDTTFAAVWLDDRERAVSAERVGAMALYSRRIHKSGELGPESIVDARICDCCQTSLIVTPEGELLVAYRDRDEREVRDISLANTGAEGWSEPRSLFRDDWLIQGCPVNGPQLATSTEVCFAAWFTGAGRGGGKVQVSARTSGQRAFGFPVTVDNGSPVGRVDITVIGPERALVTWMEQTEASFGEWRAQIITPGKKLGGPLTLARIPSERSSGFLRQVSAGKSLIISWTVPGRPPRIETARILLGN